MGAQGQPQTTLGVNPKHAEAGFQASIPGMRSKPVQREVKMTQASLEAAGTAVESEKTLFELSRTIRVVNRAMKGPCKLQPFLGVVGGEHWPEAVDPHDKRTWLQPGEYMDVPREVAFIMAGNLWNPKRPDRPDIIRKYGNHPFQTPADNKANPGTAPMTPADCPPIPDLVFVEVSSRGQTIGDAKAMYDIYCRDYGDFYEKDFDKKVQDAVEKWTTDSAADESQRRGLNTDPGTGEVEDRIITATR